MRLEHSAISRFYARTGSGSIAQLLRFRARESDRSEGSTEELPVGIFPVSGRCGPVPIVTPRATIFSEASPTWHGSPWFALPANISPYAH